MPVASVRPVNIARATAPESPRRRYVRSKIFVPNVRFRDEFMRTEAPEFKGNRRSRRLSQFVAAKQMQILNLMHAYLPGVHLAEKYPRKVRIMSNLYMVIRILIFKYWFWSGMSIELILAVVILLPSLTKQDFIANRGLFAIIF